MRNCGKKKFKYTKDYNIQASQFPQRNTFTTCHALFTKLVCIKATQWRNQK